MRIQQKLPIEKLLPSKKQSFRIRKLSPRQPFTFKEELERSQRKQTSLRLKNLLNKIDEEGQRLLKHRTLNILSQYKKFIKDFLEEVLKNLYLLKEEKDFDSKGKQKVLVLIKTVNKTLEDLVKMVLNKETSKLKLLEKLGEIKGLLIDIYS